ncbi:hypothetical protein PVK06_034473 [Gossypium arboreum]|uniref:Uncharacterized protein n=1 Tax=Gossypium arboreum TaxID=29729 RepID=A0ABR0NEM8_GOSAR|nr:hypothetical protein PVK06_034473 [Gossypium arboreum]
MSASLDKITRNLKDWNKNTYGHITTRKRNLIHKLLTIQKKMDLLDTNHLAPIEMEIRHELENVLHHEELLWKQKARCDWLYLGDSNTKFFHTRTMQRQKNNHISAICNSLSDWLFDPEAIELEASNFFPKIV